MIRALIRERLRTAILLAVCAVGLASPTMAQTEWQPVAVLDGPATAVEGDVVSVKGSSVRLWGIDAPDTGQSCTARSGQPYDCGQYATSVLQALIADNPVRCRVRYVDRDGGRVGVCTVGSVDLAAAMVARGWALAYRRLSADYVGYEARAQSRRYGLWNGRVEAPWLWRSRKQREP